MTNSLCSLNRHLRLHALRRSAGHEVEQVVCIFARTEHLVMPATTSQVQVREIAEQILHVDQTALLCLSSKRVVDSIQLGLMR